MLTSNAHVHGHGGEDVNSPLPEGWDFSRHFTSPFFPRSCPFPPPFSQWSRCHAFPVGRRGPADWKHLGHAHKHTQAHAQVILAHASTRRAQQVCGHSVSHRPTDRCTLTCTE